jgi:hypothetical protein
MANAVEESAFPRRQQKQQVPPLRLLALRSVGMTRVVVALAKRQKPKAPMLLLQHPKLAGKVPLRFKLSHYPTPLGIDTTE